LQLPVVLGVQVTALVFVFIWSKISEKIGKQRVYVIGMGFWIVLALRFPITKAHHEQTLAALAKRKAAKG